MNQVCIYAKITNHNTEFGETSNEAYWV